MIRGQCVVLSRFPDSNVCPGTTYFTQICSYRYHIRYAESSEIEGRIVQDELWLGGQSEPVVFGCQEKETGEIFRQEADGILGLSAAPLSLPSQLARAGTVDPQFTVCFGPDGGADPHHCAMRK
jgi:hypothetical protein